MQSSFFKRIIIYLKEMYPPIHALAPLFLTLTFFVTIFRLQQIPLEALLSKASYLYRFVITPAISLVLLVLLIRVMDEFKDYEDDKINFPNRPLPSGRVLLSDLKTLMIFLLIIIIILNCWNLPLLLAASIILIYSFLMFRWFFMEKQIRSSLPLALLTHHPIVYLYLGYLLVAVDLIISTSSATSGGIDLKHLWMVIPLGLASTNWELSRKIRPPKCEDRYTTYSKIWGTRNATMISIAIQLLIYAGLLSYFYQIHSQTHHQANWPLFLFAIIFAFSMIPYLLFLFSRRVIFAQNNLRSFSEAQAIIVQLSILVEFFFFQTYTMISID